ncbi:hypothetical protein BU26DRAFT_305189 [Trematosphaeria pertusa]|uniref:Uncharacterized protein n=1 Tax=Trematosphaeria pertusa TaxID=390896 RepID=A0A6A6IEC3_9PLEO|nr:uncharacterized protein BU26DRAFT_305189 [Trematosphaeria pertusa]KAF2248751.1 hypothetical protein BU26DRAFT_305189 [Trematosphaeria pertusa]
MICFKGTVCYTGTYHMLLRFETSPGEDENTHFGFVFASGDDTRRLDAGRVFFAFAEVNRGRAVCHASVLGALHLTLLCVFLGGGFRTCYAGFQGLPGRLRGHRLLR